MNFNKKDSNVNLFFFRFYHKNNQVTIKEMLFQKKITVLINFNVKTKFRSLGIGLVILLSLVL